MIKYHAIIVGAGAAGPPLARNMAGKSPGVAIIGHGRFGGTCGNSSCRPMEPLAANAYAMHLARRSTDFGFTAGDIKVDATRAKARRIMSSSYPIAQSSGH